ncbi:MAG: hypothetical protein WBN83_00180 [Desulfoprunum sp.]
MKRQLTSAGLCCKIAIVVDVAARSVSVFRLETGVSQPAAGKGG